MGRLSDAHGVRGHRPSQPWLSNLAISCVFTSGGVHRGTGQFLFTPLGLAGRVRDCGRSYALIEEH